MINLNNFVDSPGSDFTHFLQATGINDAGQIVGDGITTTGAEDAFLLTPTSQSPSTPEPSTLLLLGTGLAAVARRLRRR
jgi:probable HAF family extracellular repeat protein